MLPQNLDIPISFSVPSPLGTAQWRVRGPVGNILADAEGVLQTWQQIDLSKQTMVGVINLIVPAALNQITSQVAIDNSYDSNVTAPAYQEARIIDLMITVPGNAPAMSSLDYTIGITDQLVIMQNSFQLYADAVCRANQIPNVDAWGAASSDQRLPALMEAFQRLSRLNYEIYYDRDDVYFRNRASWGLPYQNTVGRLYNYTAADFAALDPDFINKICRAQIIEADDIMGGDPVRKERESGILISTIGQSSHQYRNGKPLRTSVCDRAMKEMGGYLKFSIGLIRS